MANPHNYRFLKDPLILARVLWPKLRLYDREREMVYSVEHNRETVAVAGNMLGKSITAAVIALCFFLRRSPCKVVTTSVDGTQLESVLWGEIRRLIQEAVIPLTAEKGGPLLVNHLHIRKVFTSGPMKGEVDGLSYMIGRVAAKGEGMLGHHANPLEDDGLPHTLFIADEASGVDDQSFQNAETWAKRRLIIGNPYPCTNHFFRAVEAGDVKAAPGEMPTTRSVEGVGLGEPGPPVEPYLRKIIHIPCEASPNVRLAKAQIAAGEPVTHERVTPGVMSWAEYQERRRTWDKVKQCIQLDARFWKGSELLLYPPHWLDASERLADLLRGAQRYGRAIGCDPGEGAAETAWYVVDEWGILEERAFPTEDTAKINDVTMELAGRWGVEDSRIMYDRGGGGKQHADQLRRAGHHIQTVFFGDPVQSRPRSGMKTVAQRIEEREDRTTYLNRRAAMYGHLHNLLDPAFGVEESEFGPGGRIARPTTEGEVRRVPRFCIPSHMHELRRQLALIPRMLDSEGRMKLPPKNKRSEGSTERTLTEIIGCSPDRADALVVALHCRDFAPRRNSAGAA